MHAKRHPQPSIFSPYNINLMGIIDYSHHNPYKSLKCPCYLDCTINAHNKAKTLETFHRWMKSQKNLAIILFHFTYFQGMFLKLQHILDLFTLRHWKNRITLHMTCKNHHIELSLLSICFWKPSYMKYDIQISKYH